jgi:hypothetical protein
VRPGQASAIEQPLGRPLRSAGPGSGDDQPVITAAVSMEPAAEDNAAAVEAAHTFATEYGAK